MINWHRLFGLALCDYFTGTEYAVEMEKELELLQELPTEERLRGMSPEEEQRRAFPRPAVLCGVRPAVEPA